MLYIGIVFFLIMFSVGRLPNIKSITLLKISLFILWILATFRSFEIGNDTKSYYELFRSICITHNYQTMTWRFEVGYLWLNDIISYLTTDFTVFLGIVNAFIYLIYYFFIKRYSKNYMMSVFLFFTLGMWGNTMNIIRLELAITLAMLGFMVKDNEKNKKIFGIGISLLAVTLQRISLVYSLGLLVPKKISKKFYKYSSIGALIGIIVLPSVMNVVGTFVPYFSEFYLQSGSGYSIDGVKLASVLNMLMALVVFLLGYIIYRRYNIAGNQISDIALQINMVWISFLILFVSLRFNLIDRCSYFFWGFATVMIPNIFEYVKLKTNRRILKGLIIFTCILYFIITTIYRPEWNSIYPYKMVLS